MHGAAAQSSVLDAPVAASLIGAHGHLARTLGRASTYDGEVATFVSVPAVPDDSDWADLAALLGPGGFADLFSADARPPSDWEPVFDLRGTQLVRDATPESLEPERTVLTLGPNDVDEMLNLVTRTRPGPLLRRTIEMGEYVGIRQRGRLVAMAGTRLRPPGWSEVSAVCTDPASRGQGLAATLVSHLAGLVSARGEGTFLHVLDGNSAALGLYVRLGFRVRRSVRFHGYRVPGHSPNRSPG